MTCTRYHLERRPTDEEAERIMTELLGQPFMEPKLSRERPLDDLLASRSHVRVLRVVARFGQDVNLTGRDIARYAEISRARVQEVLRALCATGIVTRYREAAWAIYELNEESPCAGLIRSLFERERQLTSA